MHIFDFALARCCWQGRLKTFDSRLDGLFTFITSYGTFHTNNVGREIKRYDLKHLIEGLSAI